jgi:hypothetical protein
MTKAPTAGQRWLHRLLGEWFLIGMVAAVILASLFPEFGASRGAMHAETATNLGIALVFFLHGIGLPLEALKRGVLAWRLHAVIQGLTYIVFPLLWLLFNALFKTAIPPDLMLGFAYLAALPSTISSSVAMTALGRGNVPVAIFNAVRPARHRADAAAHSLAGRHARTGHVAGRDHAEHRAVAAAADRGRPAAAPLDRPLVRQNQTLHLEHRQGRDPDAGVCGIL